MIRAPQGKASASEGSAIAGALNAAVGPIEEGLGMCVGLVEEGRPQLEEFLNRAQWWIDNDYTFSASEWQTEARPALEALRFMQSAAGYGDQAAAVAEQLIAMLGPFAERCREAAETARAAVQDYQDRMNDAQHMVTNVTGRSFDGEKGLSQIISDLEHAA